MARKRQKYPLIEALEITTLAAEGKAMGRYNEQVVFVPMTVPGDVVGGFCLAAMCWWLNYLWHGVPL